MKNIFLIFMLCALSACSTMTEVKLYSGENLPDDKIAKLYIDPHVVLSRVNDITKHPGGSNRALAHSAGMRREYISLKPGIYEIEAAFFMLCLKSKRPRTLRLEAHAGESYRLVSEIIDDTYWKPYIQRYQGEEVPDNGPFFKSLCPVDITIIFI